MLEIISGVAEQAHPVTLPSKNEVIFSSQVSFGNVLVAQLTYFQLKN